MLLPKLWRRSSSLIPLPPPIPDQMPMIDTLSAIHRLRETGLTDTHSQALLASLQWLSHHRLSQLRSCSLPHPVMLHDFQSLQEATSDPLLGDPGTTNGHKGLALKQQQDRVSVELVNLLESLRESVDAIKGDLGMKLTGLREERGEEGRRAEGVHQRLEGRVNVEAGRWRQEGEAVKLRSIYTFTMVLGALFSLLIISRLRKSDAGKAKRDSELL